MTGEQGYAYRKKRLCEDPVKKRTSQYQGELLLVDTGPASTLNLNL